MPRRRYRSIFDEPGRKDDPPSPDGKTADEFMRANFRYLKRRLKEIEDGGGKASLQTNAFVMGVTYGMHLAFIATMMLKNDVREMIRKATTEST